MSDNITEQIIHTKTTPSLPNINLETASHDQLIEYFSIVTEIAQDFNYNELKSYHVDSCKVYNGKETINFAEPTQLDKDDPIVQQARSYMGKRFRGYCPIVVDIETTGVNYQTDSIIQIAAQALTFNENLELVPYADLSINVNPLAGNTFNPQSLAITKINPFDYQRRAVNLDEALNALCKFARGAQKAHGCCRCVFVAHNASFDTSFLYYNFEKCGTKRVPFHPFTIIDTSSLAAVFLGDTRLEPALNKLDIKFDHNKTHSALYDTKQCTKLFSYCVNNARQFVDNVMHFSVEEQATFVANQTQSTNASQPDLGANINSKHSEDSKLSFTQYCLQQLKQTPFSKWFKL